jgi:hypothetical protein
MYIYALALEAAVPTVFMVWLQVWLCDPAVPKFRFDNYILSHLPNNLLTWPTITHSY